MIMFQQTSPKMCSIIQFFASIGVLCLLGSLPLCSAQCQCKVRFVGEYCGVTLNNYHPANNCSAHMYFCGKSTLDYDAIVLKTCNQKGFECDKKLNGGNACNKNIKCLCGPTLSRKRKYCGSELIGPDCAANIVYRCPIIRRHNPTAEDACPNGCQDGRCIQK